MMNADEYNKKRENNFSNSDEINHNERTYIPHNNDDNHISSEYQSISHQYHTYAKTETSIQIVGMIFIIFTIIIELIVGLMAYRASDIFPNFRLIKFIFIYLILGSITILAILQFLMIMRWNHSIRYKNTSLTRSNYQMIDHIQTIKIIIIITLVLSFVFMYLFRKYLIPIRIVGFNRYIFIYNILLRFSRISLLIYSILEIVELTRWTKKLKSIQHMEQSILQDFPRIDELMQLDTSNDEIQADENQNNGNERSF